MPCHILFAQIRAALSDNTLVGLELLDVLAAFVTDCKPAARDRVVDPKMFCRRVDEAVCVAMRDGHVLEAAEALFLICQGASGAELNGLFTQMGMSGTLSRILKLTCDPSIAEIKVTYDSCVCDCAYVIVCSCALSSHLMCIYSACMVARLIYVQLDSHAQQHSEMRRWLVQLMLLIMASCYDAPRERLGF